MRALRKPPKTETNIRNRSALRQGDSLSAFILQPSAFRRACAVAAAAVTLTLLATTRTRADDVGLTGPDPTPAPAAVAPAAPDTVVVDAATENALKGSQKYLASQQKPNGSWSARGQFPIAMTAYTLIAFLATGNLPNEGVYGKNVANGVNFLTSNQREDGLLFVQGTRPSNSWMYEHGIGTIALGEVYGSTNDPKIREKLEKCIKLILGAQNPQGGWRYRPVPTDADISVTVLQVVALRAAKNAGLDVPQETIDHAVAYVKSCAHPSGGFTYQAHGNEPGFSRTAAAIYSLQVCGLYTDPLVQKGSAFLFDHKGDRYYPTYGNYYAAPAEYMIGGDTWAKWYSFVRGELMPQAKTSGDTTYWEPIEGGGQGVSDIYATAVYTTVLAMPWHYIPLYQR
jgi:hypothetical protein